MSANIHEHRKNNRGEMRKSVKHAVQFVFVFYSQAVTAMSAEAPAEQKVITTKKRENLCLSVRKCINFLAKFKDTYCTNIREH